MNSKQQKQYDTALDKMDLTEGQRDAFDHSVKRSLIDLDTYQDTDTFSLHGYKLNRVMDDIVLAQYVDLADAFFSRNEPGVVNGILDRVARGARPGELEARDDTSAHPDG